MKSTNEELSVDEIVSAIEAQQVTSERLTRKYLERIYAFDQNGPTINSIISINGDAIEHACILDRYFKSNGITGPLHGIPFILKDNFDVENLPTTGGSLALEANRARRDAFVAQKLRQAGAIVLAKANLHEFALAGTTVSSLGGQTRNPYDLTRTPGGSSGGTGAAVAANFCTTGMGSDTVNSIRSPASAQNLVGLRPTWGLLSRSGVIPVAPTQDVVGPITRSVKDAARLLDVMVGYDPSDPPTAWSTKEIRDGYSGSLIDNGLQGVRIGVCSSLFGAEIEHVEVSSVVMDALKALEKAGATLIEVKKLGMDISDLKNIDVQKFEYKNAINRYFHHLDPNCPFKTLKDLIATGKFHELTVGSFLRDAEAIDLSINTAEYHRKLVKMIEIKQKLINLMVNKSVDVLAYPLQKRLVVPVGTIEQSDRNGILAAVTGFPAIDVPAGFSSPSRAAPLGVPIGIDFLGRPWSERLLLNIALAFENLTHLRQPPVSTQ